MFPPERREFAFGRTALTDQKESKMGASGKSAKKKEHRRRHAKSRKIARDKAAALIADSRQQAPRR
jgi:hypothetical protein